MRGRDTMSKCCITVGSTLMSLSMGGSEVKKENQRKQSPCAELSDKAFTVKLIPMTTDVGAPNLYILNNPQEDTIVKRSHRHRASGKHRLFDCTAIIFVFMGPFFDHVHGGISGCQCKVQCVQSIKTCSVKSGFSGNSHYEDLLLYREHVLPKSVREDTLVLDVNFEKGNNIQSNLIEELKN